MFSARAQASANAARYSRNYMTKKARPDVEQRVDSLVSWLELHSRQLMYGSFGLLVVAGGFWFYRQSTERQASSALSALSDAQSAMAAGNLPLAQSDLENLIKRYGSTDAAMQGHVLLAQVHLAKGEFQQGIADLTPVMSAKDAYTAASAMNLAGAALEQSGKAADAAAMYRKAAAKAPFKIDQDVYMANAARVLTADGKVDEARKIWSALAKDDQSAASAEARVRLGELEAKAGQG